MHRTDLQRKNKTGARKAVEKSEDGHVLDEAQVPSDKERAETKPKGEEPKESSQRDASLKFSIVETEPEESLTRTQPDSASAESSRSQSAAEGKWKAALMQLKIQPLLFVIHSEIRSLLIC